MLKENFSEFCSTDVRPNNSKLYTFAVYASLITVWHSWYWLEPASVCSVHVFVPTAETGPFSD